VSEADLAYLLNAVADRLQESNRQRNREASGRLLKLRADLLELQQALGQADPQRPAPAAPAEPAPQRHVSTRPETARAHGVYRPGMTRR
jgi:hypothetical protein